MSRSTILLVDDDRPLREVVQYALCRAGFQVEQAADGEEALRQFDLVAPDLVILDVNLPRLDGLAVCRAIRKRSATPVLFLSCRGDEVDRVLGLDLGGDDYVTKPFSTRELISRVRAILRRGRPCTDEELRVGPLRIAPAMHRVWIGEDEVRLTATEFRLLLAIVRAGQRVLERCELAREVYPDRRTVSERTLDSHVRRIRAKLQPVDPIETVHGVGLRLSPALTRMER